MENKIILIFLLSTFSIQIINSQIFFGENVKSVSNSHCNGINIEQSSQFPYVVLLTIKGINIKNNEIISTNCMGIILQSDVILTVAHCIEISNFYVTNVDVIAGVNDLNHDFVNRQNKIVKGYKVHKNYDNYSKGLWIWSKDNYQKNDIALIWLKEKFEFTPWVQSIKIPNRMINITEKIAISVGWGLDEFNKPSKILKKVSLRGISNLWCQQYNKNLDITKQMFCAMSLDGKSMISHGDSGGPFIYNNEVLGIISFCKNEIIKNSEGNVILICNLYRPGIFSNIFSFKNWIENSLRDGPPEKKCKIYERFCAL